MYIYKITNTITNQHYIGQTIQSPLLRWKRHKKEMRNGYHHNLYLQRAWHKYGKDAFVFEVIGQARHHIELNELEDIFIKYYDSLSPNGYNLKTGGDNIIYSQATKNKLSKIRTGTKRSQATKDKIAASVKANYQDPTVRQNILDKRTLTRSKKPKKPKKEKVYKTEEEKKQSRAIVVTKSRRNAKGYTYVPAKDRYQVQIKVNGVRVYNTYHKTAEAATKDYRATLERLGL